MLAGELVGQADDLADDRARGRVRDHAVGAFALLGPGAFISVALTNTLAPYPPLTARQSPPRKLGP
jgi:hypothetical protein